MKFLVTFVLLILSVHVSAQIALTSDDFISYGFGLNFPVGQSISFSAPDTTGLRLLVSRNGSNQTWNFSGRVYTVVDNMGGTIVLLPYPSGAAFANDPAFVSATHVYKYTSTDPKYLGRSEFLFVKIDQTGFWWLGSSQDSMGVPSKQSEYVPPYQFYKFPLMYGTTWQSSYVVHYADNSLDSESVDAIVDGYGTLITPPSTGTASLRLRERNSRKVTFDYFSYQWLTKSFYGAGLDVDQTGRPYNARYSEPTGSGSVANALGESGDGIMLHLSADPTDKATKLFYAMKSDGIVNVSLMDVLGRSVRTQTVRAISGMNETVLDTHTLATGTYFIHVAAEGMTATRELIITR